MNGSFPFRFVGLVSLKHYLYRFEAVSSGSLQRFHT